MPELSTPPLPAGNSVRMLYTNQQGFIALISVLVIGAIGLDIAVSLLVLGLGVARSSAALERSVRARGLAEACAEEAVRQAHEALACGSAGNLSLSSGSCHFSTSVQPPSGCQIESIGTSGDTTRHVQVILDQLDPDIQLTSWRDVANN